MSCRPLIRLRNVTIIELITSDGLFQEHNTSTRDTMTLSFPIKRLSSIHQQQLPQETSKLKHSLQRNRSQKSITKRKKKHLDLLVEIQQLLLLIITSSLTNSNSSRFCGPDDLALLRYQHNRKPQDQKPV